MKKLVRWSIIVFVFILSTNSFSQWKSYNKPDLPSLLGSGSAIDAIDSSCAVISCTYGKIYRTLDGGTSWKEITPKNFPSWRNGIDISMIDSLHLWIASDGGEIYYTLDGGQNWTIQFSDTNRTKFLNYIKMFDSQNGVVMGDGTQSSYLPLFLKTTDGGSTWTSVNDSLLGAWSGDTWRRLDFLSPDFGYFFESGINPQATYQTTDGCKTWKRIETPYAHVIKFYDENLGLLYKNGSNSLVFRTTNGGQSWDSTIIAGDNSWGNDIEFIKNDPSKVWLTTQTALYFSSDGGQSWKKNKTLSPSGRDLVFTDANNGWLLCDNFIWRTNNSGGIVSVINEIPASPLNFSLGQNYPNPFNPSTVISWQLTVGSFVTLKIYDVLGNEVATLVNEEQEAGTHNYELEMRNYELSGGVYYYRLKAGSFAQTKGMIYLK